MRKTDEQTQDPDEDDDYGYDIISRPEEPVYEDEDDYDY